MIYIYGDAVIESLKSSKLNFAIFQGGKSEYDPIILRCNTTTGNYNAADMIHLYIEHWAQVNNFDVWEFDENRLMEPDKEGRIYDNVFYNFSKSDDDTKFASEMIFIFDVTEPFSQQGSNEPSSWLVE